MSPKAELTVHIDVKNMDRTRLLAWELNVLADDMRVAASPFAERLEAIMDRFAGGEEVDDRDEGPET